MATRTITTKLALEGESEYRAALRNINAELGLHKSELAKVEALYQASANSLTALEAKESALGASLTALKRKHEEQTAMLEKARQAQSGYAQKAEEARGKLAALSATSGDITEKTKKYTQELNDAEASMQKAKNSADYYQKEINKTERQQAELAAQLSKTEKYLGEARRAADQCAVSIDKYGKETAQAKENTQNASEAVGALAAALAAGGLKIAFERVTEAITACVDASVQFESAMAGVSKTVEGTPEQLAAIQEGIKGMSTEIPATTAEIASVAEAAGQLGIATEDVLAFSKVMLDLGESTNLSAEEAATALARFANITGTTAADYGRLGSVIVDLGNNFATTEAEITQMATRLASAGTLAGLTEAEIMALATAMSSVGIEAEAGGTAMTQTLAAMEKAVVSGGEKLNGFARIAGMSAAEFATAWKERPTAAIQAFISGLGGLEEQGESAVLALDDLGLSGVRQSNMLKSLALASHTLTGAVSTANQAWAENTALTDEANKRYETTESKLAMCQNAFSNVQAAVGDVLAPALRHMAETGTNAFSWAADFIEKNPWVVGAIGAVASALGVLTIAVTGYTAALYVVIPLIKAFQLALSNSPAGMAAIAITTLAAAVGAFAMTLPRATNEVATLTDGLEASREAYKETTAGLVKQTEGAMALAGAVAELADKEHKTTAEKETLLGLVKQLNEEVPGLNLAYDELNGTLSMTAEDVQSVVRAMAAQQEQEAVIQRMVELERERISIEQELAAAANAYTAAVEASNKAQQDGVYADMGCIELATELNDAVQATQGAYDQLTEKLEENNAEAAALSENYETLAQSAQDVSTGTRAAGQAAGLTAEQTQALSEQAQELTGVTESLTGAQNLLAAALDEQRGSGSLSLDMALKLIDAGYAQTLAIDGETGAISVNAAAYAQLTKNRLDDQIASIASQQCSLDETIRMREEAVAALNLAGSYLEAAAAKASLSQIKDQAVSFAAQRASLEGMRKALDSYTGASQLAARASASAAKKVQTQAEQDLAKFKEIKGELDHQRAMDQASEREYYARLSRLRDQYLTDNSNLEEYRRVTQTIYKYDKELAQQQEKLWEDTSQAVLDVWSEQLQGVVDAYEDKAAQVNDKISGMSEKLAGYGELFTIQDDKMSINSIREQTQAVQAYGDTLRQLRDRGLSGGLLGEITGLGVDDASQYGQKLLGMSQEELEEYVGLWEEKQAQAKRIAEEFYKGELDALEEDYNGQLSQALDGMKDTAYQSGLSTVQGLIDGLSAKEVELYAKMNGIAKKMAEAMEGINAAASVDGSHAGGLAYVPFDGYVAQLHQGERVLTAQEAKAYIARSTPRSLELPAGNGARTADLGSMLSQAVNAMETAASANSGRYVIELHMDVNGKEFYQKTIDDFRAVAKSKPEVVSDL